MTTLTMVDASEQGTAQVGNSWRVEIIVSSRRRQKSRPRRRGTRHPEQIRVAALALAHVAKGRDVSAEKAFASMQARKFHEGERKGAWERYFRC